MTAGGQNGSGRIASVEAWRFVAIVGVVAIHTTPETVASPGHWDDPSYLLNQVARFAVPFFFVISGYFWGMRARDGEHAVRASWPAVRSLLTKFVVWSVIYALPYDVSRFADGGPLGPVRAAWWHLQGSLQHPLTLATQGTKSPLWFLVALASANLITAVFVQYRRLALLAFVAVALYAVELVSKPYLNTRFGLPIDFNTRNGPFVGTLLFATGYLLSRRGARPGWFGPGVALFVGGTMLHLAENWFVVTRLHAVLFQDFVVGTCCMGVGAAMMALSGRLFPFAPGLARLGRHALPIYLVHSIFVDWFWFIANGATVPIAGHLADMALVLALSWLAIRGLYRTRLGRALIT